MGTLLLHPTSSAPPSQRGRHVPHGHWETMGTRCSSMSSTHPASRGQILTLPHGLLSAHRPLQPSVLGGARNIVFGRHTLGVGTPITHSGPPLHRAQAGVSLFPFGVGYTPLCCHDSLQPQLRPSSSPQGLSRHALAAPPVRGPIPSPGHRITLDHRSSCPRCKDTLSA